MPLNNIPTGAGNLRYRFAFDERVWAPDGAGNTVGEWREQFITAAGLEALRGGESVIASRLTGVQPYNMMVRHSPNTARITTDWRARDPRTGKTYAIKSAVVNDKRSYVDLLVIEGEAA